MPALDNPRHESYCQDRAKGMSVQKAGYTSGFSKRSYYSVENRADVKARILELKDAPVGRAEMIRMYQSLYDKAVEANNLTVASRSLAMLAFISGHGSDPRKPQKMNPPVRRGGTPKPTKEKRAQKDRTPPSEELEEEADDGTEPAHAGGERDISDIHKTLGGLHSDT